MWVRALVVGVLCGGATAAIAWSPLIPDPTAFHAVALAVIGAIYVGFGLADGRVSVAVLELLVATGFLVLSLLGLWVAPAFVGAGLVLHGCWDLVHRPHAVTTKLPSWYPPFCAAYDFVFAAVFFALAGELAARTP